MNDTHINLMPEKHIYASKASLYGLVIIAKVDPPVPIPNTTVKPFSADGTAS